MTLVVSQFQQTEGGIVSSGAETYRSLPFAMSLMENHARTDYQTILEMARNMPVLRDRARFLLAQLRQLVQSRPNELLEVFQGLHRSAVSARDQRAEYLALTGMGSCYRTLASYEEATSCLNSALGFFTSINDYERTAGILQELGLIHRVRGEYAEALENYQQALEISELRRDVPRSRAAIHNAMGIVYSSIGDYQNGLNCLHQSLALYRLAEDRRGIASTLSNIGHTYIHLHEFAKAEEYYNRVMEIRKDLNDTAGIAMIRHSLGQLYIRQGRLEKAAETETLALEVFRTAEDRLGQIRALGHLGQIHEARGDFTTALGYLEEVCTLAEDIGDMESLEQGRTDSAKILLRLGDTEKALGILQETLPIALERNARERECIIRELLGECLAIRGAYGEAYVEIRQAFDLQRTLLDRKKQKELAELQVRHELEDAHKQKEIYRLRNEQLEMTTRQKSDELTVMAMSLVRQTELLASLKKQVREALHTAHENFQEIVDGIFEKADNRNHSDDWALFEQRLSETQSRFVQSISGTFPDLTPTELRICSLARIGLSSREISSIMNASERSVEDHRYNIRRKLDIAGGQDLARYLQEFSLRKTEQQMPDEDPGFTAMLTAHCPELSETEMKVCRLIRSNLSTKEIAAFLSLSQRTAETHRYNIRKKLEVPQGRNLAAFLSGLRNTEERT